MASTKILHFYSCKLDVNADLISPLRLCFLYRIFPIVQFRRLIWFALGFVTALSVACVFASMFQCVPIEKFWQTLGGVLVPQLGGRCINVRLYFLISGSINTVTDFALLAMVCTS